MSLLHYHSQPALRISTVGALGVNGGVAGPAVAFAGKDAALSFAEGRRYVRIWPLGEDMKISLSRPSHCWSHTRRFLRMILTDNTNREEH